MNKGFICVVLSAALFICAAGSVSATTISDAKKNKQDAEKKLNAINQDIEDIVGERDSIEAEAEEYEAQLFDTILNIQIIEHDIEYKEAEIKQAEAEYNEILAQVEAQKKAMDKRIKYMYEKGNQTYVEILLESRDYAEALNKAMFTGKLYKYDRMQLYLYEQTKERAYEKEKALQEDLDELEEIKADSLEQKQQLQALIDEYSEKIEDFNDKLAEARNKVNEYKNEIKKQTDSIRKLEEEERKRQEEEKKRKAEEEARKRAEEEARKKAEEEARLRREEEEARQREEENNQDDDDYDDSDSENKGTSDSGNSGSSSDSGSSGSSGGSSGMEVSEPVSSGSSGGSSKGQEIANYACQFIGNPYVAGGTSLTSGADCSGFTMAVFEHFGIDLPRTSASQGACGRAVSYAEAQPGDIIYYGGHVGIYIGNGLIVHASTQSTGIKISNALYRSIISVRRIV